MLASRFFLTVLFTTRTLRNFPRYPAEASYSDFDVALVPLFVGSKVYVLTKVFISPPGSWLITSFFIGTTSVVSVVTWTRRPATFAVTVTFCPTCANPGGSEVIEMTSGKTFGMRVGSAAIFQTVSGDAAISMLLSNVGIEKSLAKESL